MKREEQPFNGQYDSLETLADDISEVLQCPITIEDAGHRLLAYSSHERQIDPARTATIVGRRVPEAVIQSLWQGGIMHMLLQSPEPIRIDAIADVGLGKRVAIAIRKNEDVLGYIWVLAGDRELDDAAMGQLKKAAQAVRMKLLHHRMLARQEEEGRQDFFWQMLTGHLDRDDMIRERARKLSLALPAAYTVAVLQFDSDIGDIQQQLYDMLASRSNVRIVLRAADRNRLILLCGVDGEKSPEAAAGRFIQSIAAQFSERLPAHPAVTGGGGSLYGSYALAETCYKEALTVLELKPVFADSLGHASLYSELGYYRFIPTISRLKRQHPSVPRSLQRLRDYDRDNNASLAETLERFLAADSNAKEAAVRLHVHTNTLMYRLKRIAEIAEIDLTDADQKMSLLLEFQAEKWIAAKETE